MSFPEDPKSIIIKNSFYPKGLTEENIYTYYQSVKSDILKQVINRKVFFFLFIDTNDYIVRRKGAGQIPYQLTMDNYDKTITGRTVSIVSTMNNKENFGIIDIDSKDFEKAKETTCLVYDFILNNYDNVLDIRFTGKSSFHIIVHYKSNLNINDIRLNLRKMILNSKLTETNNITLNYKRTPIAPNIDLSPNKLNGGFITLYSLSQIGLKCSNISRSDIMKIKKEDFKIKV